MLQNIFERILLSCSKCLRKCHQMTYNFSLEATTRVLSRVATQFEKSVSTIRQIFMSPSYTYFFTVHIVILLKIISSQKNIYNHALFSA